MARLSEIAGGKRMDDMHVVAALLTLALHTPEHQQFQKTDSDHWRRIWNDYNSFLKKLDESDESIDNRGIHPD